MGTDDIIFVGHFIMLFIHAWIQHFIISTKVIYLIMELKIFLIAKWLTSRTFVYTWLNCFGRYVSFHSLLLNKDAHLHLLLVHFKKCS